jgi:hypothetical protein
MLQVVAFMAVAAADDEDVVVATTFSFLFNL